MVLKKPFCIFNFLWTFVLMLKPRNVTNSYEERRTFEAEINWRWLVGPRRTQPPGMEAALQSLVWMTTPAMSQAPREMLSAWKQTQRMILPHSGPDSCIWGSKDREVLELGSVTLFLSSTSCWDQANSFWVQPLCLGRAPRVSPPCHL